jgi:hypothetical protein
LFKAPDILVAVVAAVSYADSELVTCAGVTKEEETFADKAYCDKTPDICVGVVNEAETPVKVA